MTGGGSGLTGGERGGGGTSGGRGRQRERPATSLGKGFWLLVVGCGEWWWDVGSGVVDELKQKLPFDWAFGCGGSLKTEPNRTTMQP